MEKQVAATKVVFGNGSQAELHFSGFPVDCTSCGLPVIANLASCVEQSLAVPLEFPPLEQAIVEGDRVVLAVDPAIPQMPKVVEAVVKYLLSHRVDASQLRIVLAGHESADRSALESAMVSVTKETITVEMHDADDSSKVAYVAANQAADPIYMNRTLVEAEVVIPITCARGRDTLDYVGAYSVFPRLSDRRTRGRFLSLQRLLDSGDHEKLRSWADEAAWWVGLVVAVQVIPGSSGTVSGMLAGSPQTIEQAVQERMETAWRTRIAQPVELVLALVDGGRSQQNWDNVARSIHSARRAVVRGGAIVVCTQLEEKPGRALRKLAAPNRSNGTLARQLASDSSDDALAAAVILDAARDCHLYLLSGLANEKVEELGIGAIENIDQLDHLIDQYGSHLILGSAQHRMVTCDS